MDVIQKIRDLTGERGWTEYRLVKETGLPQSTIANIFHRNTVPSVQTLEAICGTFGISLSQFFAEGSMIFLTLEQEELLQKWAKLSGEQRAVLLDLMGKMN